MAALRPSKTLLSTPSGLSAVFTRYGPSVPMSTALRTRFVPCLPIYRVTSPVPIECRLKGLCAEIILSFNRLQCVLQDLCDPPVAGVHLTWICRHDCNRPAYRL